MHDSALGALSAGELSPLYRLYFWGIELIRQIQTIESSPLTVVMKAITLIGSEAFYLPVLLFMFWCIDEKQGIRLMFLFMISAVINIFLKDFLKQPRPFTLDPTVGLAFENSYGIPSGHAQFSLTFWGFLASWISANVPQRRRLIWVCAIGMMLLIAFTRLYLGVHFPTDLLAGWLLGVLALTLYRVLGARVDALLLRGGTRSRMISAAALAMLTNALGVNVMLGGAMLGIGVGYALSLRHGRFSARSPRYAMLCVRFMLGIVGGGAIGLFLSLILPGKRSLFAALPLWGAGSPYHSLAEFVLAGALGLWMSFGAPWCFLRLHLAGAEAERTASDTAEPQ
ncbi:MAG: phosphatase PAP2 family protein [Treponema sp.]|jgi:membrane-associated phospholipid phosphatase|nr:phosphatase PAP2 family protein [Treponema sp.]